MVSFKFSYNTDTSENIFLEFIYVVTFLRKVSNGKIDPEKSDLQLSKCSSANLKIEENPMELAMVDFCNRF